MNSDSVPNLPPVLADIAEAAGLPAAILLAKARGGTSITIPNKAPGTKLAEIVGIEAAEDIIKAFGAGDLEVPFGPFGGANARRRRVQEAYLNGASESEAARQGGVHMRTARRQRARMKKSTEQTDLFNQN